MTSSPASEPLLRQATPEDIPGIIALCRQVYPSSPAWSPEQLASHQRVFPQGQLVVVAEDEVIGFAASLVVLWDDYTMDTSWRDFTDQGMFTNHDPEGHTLYGAEIMVHPAWQGRGIGRRLYAARRELTLRLGLRRIRAGARLRGYHNHARRLSAAEYVQEVVAGRLHDPTLTFQLRQGFHVLGVAAGYLRFDPESLGHAAVIEWVPAPGGSSPTGSPSWVGRARTERHSDAH